MSGPLVVVPADQLRELVNDAVREVICDHAPGAAPEVLDRAGAAAFLGVGLTTLHRLVKAGKIRERRLGEMPRYLRSELIEDVCGERVDAAE